MVKWMFLVVLIISGGILAFLYVNIKNIESLPRTATSSPLSTTRVIHSYKDGVHRFSGEIRLPHSCFSVESDTIRDSERENAIIIEIRSVDHLLDQRFCAQIVTRYPFQVLAEAGEDVLYSLRVDGKVTPIRVLTVDWENPNGTLINK